MRFDETRPRGGAGPCSGQALKTHLRRLSAHMRQQTPPRSKRWWRLHPRWLRRDGGERSSNTVDVLCVSVPTHLEASSLQSGWRDWPPIQQVRVRFPAGPPPTERFGRGDRRHCVFACKGADVCRVLSIHTHLYALGGLCTIMCSMRRRPEVRNKVGSNIRPKMGGQGSQFGEHLLLCPRSWRWGCSRHS